MQTIQIRTLLSSMLIGVFLTACVAAPEDAATTETPTTDDPIIIETTPPVVTPTNIIAGDEWKYFKGTQSPGTNWNTVNYNDTDWLTGASGFGYSDNDDVTVLTDMANNYSTLYTRKEFNRSDANAITSMVLSIDFDDGFIAYLNGVEVARSASMPTGAVDFETTAQATREAGVADNIDLTAFIDNLIDGKNILAVEVHNQSLNSSDASLITSLYFNGNTTEPVVEPAPVDPVVEPEPVDPVVVEPAPVDPVIEPTPIDPVIVEPAPIDPVIPPVVNTGPLLVTLTATETSGLSQPQTKIRSGVPFAKGTLLATDTVALFDDEQVLPTQVKTLSEWSDGSIRWLLVDSELALAANESKPVTLQKITDGSSISGDTIDIQETNEFITVNTGPLTVQVPKLYGGIIHTASINGQEVISAPSVPTTDRGAYISVFDSSDNSATDYFGGLLESTSTPLNSDPIKTYIDSVNSSGDSDFNLYSPFNLEVVVEEDAPLHSVIRVSGTHLNQSGLGFSTFIVRLHFYKGESEIRVAHSMIYTGDETQQISGYGLRLPMSATDSTTIVEGQVVNSGIGEVRHLEYRNHEVNGSQNSGQALGYIGRSKNNVNMSIVLRDMAEHFPKSLVTTNNSLEVQLYPESTSLWNLTKYTPEPGDTDFPGQVPAGEIATKAGETNRFTNQYFLRGAQGLSTSDDYVISFGTGALDTSAIETNAAIIDQGPIMLVAPASWYSDAKVMGIGSFAFEHDANTSEGHFRIDKVLQITRDFMRVSQRQEFDWFGIEDYGDIRGRFFGGKGDNHNWYEKGRYGWSGNSGEPSNQLWVQYLRQPSQQTFLDAEALARHTLDQQTVHFGTSTAQSGTELDGRNMLRSVGSIHRHGVQAWSGYAGSPDYSHVAGVETYYYLTGDQRAKEVLYEQGQFITRLGDPKTSIKNGLEVVDRAAAVFFDQSNIANEFENKAVLFVNYLNSDPNGNGYNAVEVRLIDRANENGIHDRTDGSRSNDSLYDGGFEYFVRGAPGILYRHERTGDPIAASLIFDAANILTVGDPKNQNGDGDDWNIGVDGHAGNVFYHINSIAYAAEIAASYGVNGTAYYELAKRSVENNTHGGNDTNDTSPISLATLSNLPDDWTNWMWTWQEDDAFNPNNPGILWLDRVVMYQNNFIQDYHSYRAFIHLATGAAIVNQGEMQLR